MSATQSPQRMKQILFTRYRNIVVPMMLANDRKAKLQANHTDAVDRAANSQERKIVLDEHPPPINNYEEDLTEGKHDHCPMKERILYTPTRAESRRMLASTSAPRHHMMISIFSFYATHPTTLTHPNLWGIPTDAIRESSQLETRGQD